MRKPLRLELVGEYSSIVIEEDCYNNEKPDYYIIATDLENIDFKTYKWFNANKLGIKKVYFNNEFLDKQYNHISHLLLCYRKDRWQEKLLTVIDKYETIEQVPLREAIEAVYDIKETRKIKAPSRFSINQDMSHLLDFNEFMMKVIFPIEDLKGDVYYFYLYQDRYVVVKEFLYDKIYVIDFFHRDTARLFCGLLNIEIRVCKLKLKSCYENSNMANISIQADEKRIAIILDPNSPKDLIEKAKGRKQ